MKNNFGSQLLKGFVRSAVNQVGRDGGKVISNKIYKDAHASKVSVVGAAQQPQPEVQFIDGALNLVTKNGQLVHFENEAMITPDWAAKNLTPVIYSHDLVINLLFICISLGLPIVSEFYFSIRGLQSFSKDSIDFRAILLVKNVTGGYSKEVVTYNLPSAGLGSSLKLKGIFCFALVALLIVWHYWLFVLHPDYVAAMLRKISG